MDELDSLILQKLQNDFPLAERPFDEISRQLEITPDQLWDRIEKLISKGVIRRFGASLDSRKMGFSSTLASIKVGTDSVDKAAEIVAHYPEVTHSYLRNGQFNIWFTLIASGQDRIEIILEEIRTALSLESSDILNLPVKKLFKLNARF